jgi:hypothetical protein
MATFRQEIANGNRGVLVTANDMAGPFSARLWVNVRKGWGYADATTLVRKFTTLPRAIKWAQQELAD